MSNPENAAPPQWCSRCYLMQPYPRCCFCGEPLVALNPAHCEQLGTYQAVCSLARLRTEPHSSLKLGRNEPESAILFKHKDFISRQHALVQVRAAGLELQDMGSANGTFVLSRHGSEQKTWQRLEAYQTVLCQSGDPILLGWETLCQIWLAWIPCEVAPETLDTWQPGTTAVILVGEAHLRLSDGVVIQEQAGRHVISNLTGQRGFVAVNNQEVISMVLQPGDRVVVQDQVYEYTGSQLLPAAPLRPIDMTIDQLVIPGRLHLEECVRLHSGKLTALIGPSGAGKSSLVEWLAGWIRGSQAHYTIRAAQQQITSAQMQRYLVYLPQGDILYENLTVASSMFYIAALLAPNRGLSKHAQVINVILQRMGLQEVWQQRIRTLSGGQRRRVQIAQALLHEQASILLLDEPTTGLDLANDHTIMQMLQSLAHQGRLVICTTHHLANIDLCDEIILLRKGKLANQGSPLEIADDEHIYLGPGSWQSLYTEELSTPSQSPQTPPLRPVPWLGRSRWWILLRRRIEEFCHPPVAWRSLLSQLVFIPLLIGAGIRIAWPVANGDEKRFFLCAVAAFWLAMSHAAQELRLSRYQRLLHERQYGRHWRSSLVALVIFYAATSLIQTAGLVAGSLDLIERKSMVSVFVTLTWTLGICGSLIGLNLGMLEARVKIPTTVSVPCLTIMQLLFSELVMGLVLMQGCGYFEFKWHELREILYVFTFSRYADMAYQAAHNTLGSIPPAFWYNVLVLGCCLLLPLGILALALKTARP